MPARKPVPRLNLVQSNLLPHRRRLATSRPSRGKKKVNPEGFDRTGPRPTGRRILGHGFNPISVFFCHRPDGPLAALLYEVTNTFHERHGYIIATPSPPRPKDGEGDHPKDGGGVVEEGPACRRRPEAIRQTVEKAFFVSPFMDMGLTYDFTVHPPGEAVSIVVAVRRGDTPILTASFAGRRRPLTDRQLLLAFLTHPPLTWKVTLGIHWEAVKMMFKGARYRHRGSPPKQPVTVGSPR